MDAVVFKGPYDIQVERRPKPSIQGTADAVVKVEVAGICGSELHPYRGVQKTATGHVMGHEFVGVIEAVGSEVRELKAGQRVICIFSTAWYASHILPWRFGQGQILIQKGSGSCWFCRYGFTNRCEKALAIGTQQSDGGQAEYVRVPDAEGTLVQVPLDVSPDLLVLMSDIFPTGYYAATRALDLFHLSSGKRSDQSISPSLQFRPQPLSEAVFVCIGCGPVGLCAILTAVARGVGTVFVVDSVDDRLNEAAKLGGIPLKLGIDDVHDRILQATNGRGADAVIEAVGNSSALQSAFEYLRPAGSISSIGFHHSPIPFTATQAYQKNVSMSFGRAPVRAVFEDALALLRANQDKLQSFITHRLPLSSAAQGYELFDKQMARKVLLTVSSP
ncbi:alcohol dehydrogenase [Cladophialophora carrionii]|uniref:Alcohol dehydrogenase n=1 Tax=Cladophialophora carrionii TaxID=86049 RepID=A0A1C1CTF1_9EURO|nr:alcohol dehydrogenase [Cladophialophora carrionii]